MAESPPTDGRHSNYLEHRVGAGCLGSATRDLGPGLIPACVCCCCCPRPRSVLSLSCRAAPVPCSLTRVRSPLCPVPSFFPARRCFDRPSLRRHPSAVSGLAGQWPCTGSLGTELPPGPCHPPAESAVVSLSPRAPEPSHGSCERPGNGRRCRALRSPHPARPPAARPRPGETFR